MSTVGAQPQDPSALWAPYSPVHCLPWIVVLKNLDAAFLNDLQLSNTPDGSPPSEAASHQASITVIQDQFKLMVQKGVFPGVSAAQLDWAELELWEAYDTWFRQPAMLDVDYTQHMQNLRLNAPQSWDNDVDAANSALGDLWKATMWEWMLQMDKSGVYNKQRVMPDGTKMDSGVPTLPPNGVINVDPWPQSSSSQPLPAATEQPQNVVQPIGAPPYSVVHFLPWPVVKSHLKLAFDQTIQANVSQATTISTAAALRATKRGLANQFVELVTHDPTPQRRLQNATRMEQRWALQELLLAYEQWYQAPRMVDRETSELDNGKTWKAAVNAVEEALVQNLGGLDNANMWLWMAEVETILFFSPRALTAVACFLVADVRRGQVPGRNETTSPKWSDQPGTTARPRQRRRGVPRQVLPQQAPTGNLRSNHPPDFPSGVGLGLELGRQSVVGSWSGAQSRRCFVT